MILRNTLLRNIVFDGLPDLDVFLAQSNGCRRLLTSLANPVHVHSEVGMILDFFYQPVTVRAQLCDGGASPPAQADGWTVGTWNLKASGNRWTPDARS